MRLSDGRSIMEVLLELVRRTFDFKGRSRRSDGWIWLGLELAFNASFALSLWNAPDRYWVAYDAIYLVLILPVIGWTVRRLHDVNLAGWWAVPVILGYFWSFVEWSSDAWATIALVVVAIIVFLPLLIPPDAGPNRFGPDPRKLVSDDFRKS